MGNWRTRLQRASFRGAAFEVDSAEFSGGRRVAVHEFPGRDNPYPEDLGRKSRSFTISAYCIGRDYDEDRDALRYQLEQPGPGELVHPYYGRMLVQVAEVSLRESTREGGMARFGITFHEAEEPASFSQPDTSSLLDLSAATALVEAIAGFGNSFDVLGMAADLVSEIEDTVENIMGAVEGVVEGAAADAAALVRSPANLAASIAGSLNRIRQLAETPFEALALYRMVMEDSSPPAPAGTTPARVQQAGNVTAMVALVKQAALAEAAKTAAVAEFESADQAGEIQAILLDALDAQAETASDEMYARLRDLRVAIVRDFTARSRNLARVVNYTPPVTLPALVIAQRLYGDATRADEITARNNCPHPGFVTGGEPLEVLTNA